MKRGESGKVIFDPANFAYPDRVVARSDDATAPDTVNPSLWRQSQVGVKGVIDVDAVTSGKVPIIAPGTIASFDKFAVGENVVAGNAMARRSFYAFCSLLDPDPKGLITSGIGIRTTDGPTVSYISPTDSITETGSRRTIAGIEFEFRYAPDTEAPEEMHIWIPHARTRDARNVARYLDETLERWGADAQVHFGPHTWPVWGNENITEFIASQRDTYKYIHDQALRLANKGFTPLEAAEVIELPEELGRPWWNRGYHGTLHHDVRAVFTKELAIGTAIRSRCIRTPPVDAAQRYVSLIGADAILARAVLPGSGVCRRWNSARRRVSPVTITRPPIHLPVSGKRRDKPAWRRR